MTEPQPSVTTTSTCDLLVLAELNPDLLLGASAAEVRFGQVETELRSAALTLGSSGAITAAAAVALGLRVSLCAVVGMDPFGELAVQSLAEFGVAVDGVQRRKDLSTGLTVVLNTPGGDRALLTYPGAMAAMMVADIDDGMLAGARHVHVSSVFLQRGLQPDLADLFKKLGTMGVGTSLDTGWDPDEDWSLVGGLLPHLDVLLPNEAELLAITRALALKLDPALDPVVGAARELAACGPSVALKLGGGGALLATATAGWQLSIDPVVPVDTTGAGDNFNAGLLAARLGGAGPAESLATAVAAGTVSVRGTGGTGAMMTPSQSADLVPALLAAVTQLW